MTLPLRLPNLKSRHMNKQQRKNSGLNGAFIVFAVLVLGAFLAAPWLKLDGDNPFYNISVLKKVLVYLCYGASGFWLYLCMSRTVYEPTKKNWLNLVIYNGVFAAPLLVAWIIVSS